MKKIEASDLLSNIVHDETIFVPNAIREKLRIPFGKLYKGFGINISSNISNSNELETSLTYREINEIRKAVSDAVKVISVGDATAFHLLKLDILPDLMIIDELIQRKPISENISIALKKATKSQRIVSNPPGTITLSLIKEIENALNETTPIRILVKGEEDLAALPALLIAPINSIILYGQPNQGLVLVKITESKKQEIRELFNQLLSNSQQNKK